MMANHLAGDHRKIIRVCQRGFAVSKEKRGENSNRCGANGIFDFEKPDQKFL
jgi:hypothetical protein